MKSIYYIALFCLLASCSKVNEDCNLQAYPNAPAKEWFQSHSGTKEESHGHYILTCSDGGFLQIGETGFLADAAKILVIKTNSEGEVIWKKEFSDGNHNLGNSAIEADDGYIICGALNENSSILKLDKADGSIIFQESMNNGGSDAFEHLIETQSGFIAVGYIEAEDNSNTFFSEGKGFITLLDATGIKQSSLNINDVLAHAYRIKRLGAGFIISGLTADAQAYGLVKIDASGNVLWSKNFGGTGPNHCFGMDVNEHDEIFLTGHTLSDTPNWDTYTMMIDSSGTQVWESKKGNPRGFRPKFIHDEAWDIKATPDGGCIVVAGTGDEYGRYKRCCGSDGDNSNTWHVYLLKYDSNGQLEWQQTYGGNGDDWAGEAVDLTPDNGVIIGVDNGAFGFLKIEPF